MKEFLDGNGVKRTLKARGISKSAAQSALSEELRSRGIDARNWPHLSKASQRSLFSSALEGLRAHSKPVRGIDLEKATGISQAGISLSGLHGRTRRAVLSSLKSSIGELPAMHGKISGIATCRPSDAPENLKNAYAWYDSATKTITLNLKFFGRDSSIRTPYLEDAAIGYHPKGPGVEMILSHEFAHAVDDELVRMGVKSADGSVSSFIQPRIMHDCGLSMLDVERAVSGYSVDGGPPEWFAEALAEALSGDEPRPVARELLKWVKEQMGATQ